MSTAHSEEIKPDSMTAGFTRLIIIVILGLLAASIFYAAAMPLKNSSNKHRNEVSINAPLPELKA
jgi:hypothetical protein